MESIGTWSPAVPRDGFAERLLGPTSTTFSRAVLRAASGTSLALLFGLACSLGQWPSLQRPGTYSENLAASFAMATPPLVFALGFAPALWVLLTLFGRSVDVDALVAASTRTIATVGLVLGGLAPAAALFELTAGGSLGEGMAMALELVALFVSGVLGLRTFTQGVLGALPAAEREGAPMLLLGCFAVLGTLLGARLFIPALFAAHGVAHGG